MPTEEEIEAVAKAIATALAPAYWDREEPTDEDHRRAAVAAIKAIDDLHGVEVS